MAAWPKRDVLRQAFFNGLFSDNERSRTAAGFALAKMYKGEPSTGADLKKRLLAPIEPGLAAAILHALAQGWPDIDGLDDLIDDAKYSRHPHLIMSGIGNSIQRGTHTDTDRSALLAMAQHRLGIHHGIAGGISAALVGGWPHDEMIFDACLKGWQRGHAADFDSTVAMLTLITGYGQDPKVVDAVCDSFKSNEGVLLYGSEDIFQLIRKTYQRNPFVGPAIDTVLEKKLEGIKAWPYEAAHLAAISCSPFAKQLMLDSIHTTDPQFVFWPSFALLVGWGMADTETANALMHLANSDKADFIAHHIPNICPDKTEARTRLLALRTPRRPDFVVRGFCDLGLDHNDRKVADVVLHFMQSNEDRNSAVMSWGIEHFGRDCRVREIAITQLKKSSAPLDAMAKAYRDDVEMQDFILSRCAPLPEPLRRTVVSFAARISTDLDSMKGLLARYTEEQSASIMCEAASGYYESVRRSGLGEDVRDRLLQNLRALGPNLDQVRLSAFVGVLKLGFIDLFRDLREAHNHQSPMKVRLLEGLLPSEPSAMQALVEHWQEVKMSLGASVFDRLQWHGSDASRAWKALAPYSLGYPKLQDEFLEYCEGTAELLYPDCLDLLAKLKPQSDLLMQHCRRAIEGRSSGGHMSPFDHTGSIIKAGYLLGTQFSETPHLESYLASKMNGPGYETALIALCIGWRNSKHVKDAYEAIITHKWCGTNWPLFANVIAATASVEQFLHQLKRLLRSAPEDIWVFPGECTAAISLRLRREENFPESIIEGLNKNPTDDLCLSMPRLIATALGTSSELRGWCEREILRRTEAQELAAEGFDLVSGRLRSVVHGLLDVLMPYGPGSAYL